MKQYWAVSFDGGIFPSAKRGGGLGRVKRGLFCVGIDYPLPIMSYSLTNGI